MSDVEHAATDELHQVTPARGIKAGLASTAVVVVVLRGVVGEVHLDVHAHIDGTGGQHGEERVSKDMLLADTAEATSKIEEPIKGVANAPYRIMV